MEMLLGEGPVWLASTGEPGFVDIRGRSVYRLHAKSGALHTTNLPVHPTFVVPDDTGGLLVGAGNRIYRLDDKGLGAPVAQMAQPAHNRTNDATVDSQGRLWFGTMDDREQQATGAIWCLDAGRLRATAIRAVITNGPAVSGDGRLLYHADSTARAIWRSEIASDGMVSDTQMFAQIAPGDGYPDGVVVDSEDCLWVGLWDGWAARRYAPDGALIDEVRFPCSRVTKIAFGGPDLRTAYATTARIGLDAAALAAQPLAGSLFAFTVDVPGQPAHRVRLGLR